MPAPLHPYSATCAHAHIRVGLAINACPSTLVFSVLCSSTHTSWASIQCMPLYTRIQRLVLTHTYELGWQSLRALLHSSSVTGAHTHIRVGLAINACPFTLLFTDLCLRTYTSWASNLCRPLYTRIQSHVLTHTYELGSHSMHAPLHSYSVILCSRTHTRWAAYAATKITVGRCRWWGLHKLGVPIKMISLSSWARIQCLPRYTRIQ